MTGLLNHGSLEHESKSIILDNNGNLYTNIGAYSNDCQTEDRSQRLSRPAPRHPILNSTGGIQQFKADQTDQTYVQDRCPVRYRPAGMSWDWTGTKAPTLCSS